MNKTIIWHNGFETVGHTGTIACSAISILTLSIAMAMSELDTSCDVVQRDGYLLVLVGEDSPQYQSWLVMREVLKAGLLETMKLYPNELEVRLE